MTIVNMYEAKTHLSKFIARVQQGERVIVAKNGVPVADIVPHVPKHHTIKFGVARGKYRYNDDDLVGVDPDVMEMFLGRDWQKL